MYNAELCQNRKNNVDTKRYRYLNKNKTNKIINECHETKAGVTQINKSKADQLNYICNTPAIKTNKNNTFFFQQF